VKFYRDAMARGVKPIIGVVLLVAERGERAQPSRIALLCMDERGYRNLTALVSRAYIDGRQRDLPLIERDWLGAEGLGGLIALSCGADGDVGRALALGKSADAARHLASWRDLFGDRYYLEVSRVGREGEEALLAATVTLAAAERVPLVATNDVRFLAPEDFDAHEARVCIHEGVLLAAPQTFEDLRFDAAAPEGVHDVTLEFVLERPGALRGLALHVEVFMTDADASVPDVSSAQPGSHWPNVFMLLSEELQVEAGKRVVVRACARLETDQPLYTFEVEVCGKPVGARMHYPDNLVPGAAPGDVQDLGRRNGRRI
jgi:hypothetical protein